MAIPHRTLRHSQTKRSEIENENDDENDWRQPGDLHRQQVKGWPVARIGAKNLVQKLYGGGLLV
jgi:hypothetical protein